MTGAPRLAAVLLVTLAGCGTTRARPVPPGAAIVVAHFGDSTCSTGYLPPSQRVDALLNARLAARYPEQRIVNLNLARPRETVRELLDRRWAHLRRQVPHVDVALVRYGQNDLTHVGTADFRAHLDELCDRLRDDYPGVHLVLETNTWIDPAHGGDGRRNARYEAYWEVVRTVARARGVPLVDVAARRRREAAAGNWDLNQRSRRLAEARFGGYVDDASHDGEMTGVTGWLGDVHPSARGVALVADEEARTLVAAWPDGLPRAAGP